MVSLTEDFVSMTGKVRQNGNSFIIGFTLDQAKLLELKKGTMLQIYVKPIGFVEPRQTKPKETKVYAEHPME